MSHVSSSKINNDVSIMKKNIDFLGSNLSQCTFKHNKLESMFRKKQVPHIHAHIPPHTSHAHYAYTHYEYMYARVYTCTYRGRKRQNFILID